MDRYGSGIKWGHHGHPKLAVFRTGWAWISHLTLERWVILFTNPGFIKAAWFVQLVQAKNVVNDGTSSSILCSPCMCISVLRKWFCFTFNILQDRDIPWYSMIFHDIPWYSMYNWARNGSNTWICSAQKRQKPQIPRDSPVMKKSRSKTSHAWEVFTNRNGHSIQQWAEFLLFFTRNDDWTRRTGHSGPNAIGGSTILVPPSHRRSQNFQWTEWTVNSRQQFPYIMFL